MASAWTFQDPKQVEKVGADAASWYVGWYDAHGLKRCKSYGPGPRGNRLAEEAARIKESELLTGQSVRNEKMTWKDFRAEYETKIAAGMDCQTRNSTLAALDRFERIVHPKRIRLIRTQTLDEFIAKRKLARGRKKGELLSPATVNKDLRHLRAVLRIAHEWEYLPRIPKVRMLKEPVRLPLFVTPDHFAAMYGACDKPRMPRGLPHCPPGDWWRALLMTAYMTGWRIGQFLALDRRDVDLDEGWAVTRWDDNKGKRDMRIKLHPIVVQHLRQLGHFEKLLFPWNANRRTLDSQFMKMQEKAGIHLPCSVDHEHTRYCHTYGFHDLRRAFATMNATRMTPEALQALMQHKSWQTTQLYINLARQTEDAVAGLYVPPVRGKEVV